MMWGCRRWTGMQNDSSLFCLSEQFGPIATHQNQKPIFIILLITATQGVIAAEATVQEEIYPIIHIGNECRIKTENISSGCPVGWQEEKEWNVNNGPIAILGKGKPLHCIEPCIKLQDQEIWLDCIAINYTLVKYTYRCTKSNTVDEFTIYFKEQVPSFPNETTVTPEPQTPKTEGRKYIGTAVSIGVLAVLTVLVICLN
ncbi:uncharacterized protein LOC144503803 isoform X2 [Mustelus asterias]